MNVLGGSRFVSYLISHLAYRSGCTPYNMAFLCAENNFSARDIDMGGEEPAQDLSNILLIRRRLSEYSENHSF